MIHCCISTYSICESLCSKLVFIDSVDSLSDFIRVLISTIVATGCLLLSHLVAVV